MELCLTGDVMSGRGVDQILQHPGDPRIHERGTKSALRYVELAEQRSGPIPRGVEPAYVWGDALDALRDADPDAFVVNLETAVTDRGTPWPDKGIQYRMHPANVGILSVAGVDAAVLANNHALDWSHAGLEQTLDVLGDEGILTAGAGRDREEAWSPVRIPAATGGSVLVLAVGSASSGIPRAWAAGDRQPGVAMLDDLSEDTVDRVAALVQRWAAPDDVVVLSVHWGPNWGYAVPVSHRRFAHAVVERAGVHVVHGHSSHHPMGIEVHRRRLILYGCGDLLTDYEGIHGQERYRGELGALYLPTVDGHTGELQRLELIPTEVRRMRLSRPAPDDVAWLANVLHQEGAAFGTSVTAGDDGRLHVQW